MSLKNQSKNNPIQYKLKVENEKLKIENDELKQQVDDLTSRLRAVQEVKSMYSIENFETKKELEKALKWADLRNKQVSQLINSFENISSLVKK